MLCCCCQCPEQHGVLFVCVSMIQASPCSLVMFCGCTRCELVQPLCALSSSQCMTCLQSNPAQCSSLMTPSSIQNLIMLSTTLPVPFHRSRLSRSDPTLDQFDSCVRSSVYNTHVMGHQDQASVSASSLPAILHDEQGLSLVSASLVFAGMLLHMTNSLYYSGAASHESQSTQVYNYFHSHGEQLMKGIRSEL